MRILGTGLIAKAIPAGRPDDGLVAFAQGVADSSCTDPGEFAREKDLLEGAVRDVSRSGDRLIYFSGAGAMYSDWSMEITERTPVEPRTAYGRHQLECEAILSASRCDYLIARLANVVGPSNNTRQLVPSLVRQVLGGTVTVQRSALRDLIDARALGWIVRQIAERAPRRTVVNVATGQSLAAPLIVGVISEILDKDPIRLESHGGSPQRFSIALLVELLGKQPFPDPDPGLAALRSHVPRIAELLG